jgi:hypothetical protein
MPSNKNLSSKKRLTMNIGEDEAAEAAAAASPSPHFADGTGSSFNLQSTVFSILIFLSALYGLDSFNFLHVVLHASDVHRFTLHCAMAVGVLIVMIKVSKNWVSN